MNATLLPIAPPPLREDLRISAILAVASAIATAALFPYLLVVMPELLSKIPKSIPLPLLILIQSLQAGGIMAVLSFVGLRMGHRVGLGAPLLRAWTTGNPRPRFAWPVFLSIGLVIGVVICALDPLFAAQMPAALSALPKPAGAASAGVGFLASFYGGISEELMMRLFLMTGMVWLLWWLSARRASPWMFWSAIIVAAVVFGAGHLPAAAKLWPLDGVVIARTIALNGIGGLVFGWLYWKRGIEAAMLAHFGTDLVLHVFAPLLFG